MDIKTMISFLAIIHLVQVIVLAIQFRVNKQFSGVGWWLLWSLSEALGFFFLSLREFNISIFIFFQNLLVFYGTVFTYMGVRRFLGKNLNPKVFWAVFIGYALVLTSLLTVFESITARGTLVFLSTGIVASMTAWILFTESPASIRFSANFTASVFTVHAVIMFVTGIAKTAGLTSNYPLDSTFFNYLTIIDAMLLSLLITFGLIIMLNHRLHESLAESLKELKDSEARNSEHLAELEKSNREKDTFYSVLAHDLRSPFNSLLGFTRILAEEFATMKLPDLEKTSAAIHRSAERLYNLVESLLQWSRTQRGTVPCEPEMLDLNLIADSVLQSLRVMTDSKSTLISKEIISDLKAFADKQMLETILRNLVMNAIKFTEKGGEITVRARPDKDGMILVAVSDTGIGMNPGFASTVFSLEKHNSRKGTLGETGSGLGLIITKEFVHKLGGRIWLESTEGKGSTFFFTLPAGS